MKSGLLEIDLAALAGNYQILKEKVGENCTAAGVIKANAYGLGADKVAQTLLNNGCSFFFVATLDEAISLRDTVTDQPIAVLNGLGPDQADVFLEHNLWPVLNSPKQIIAWQKTAQDTKQTLPTIIHFDTGMNRLGLSHNEAQDLIAHKDERLNGLNLQWVMTHFACADEKDHPLTAQQAQAFQEIAAHFPNAKKSLGNSPGVFRHVDYHIDMVRPGYALYGGNPTPEADTPMKQVVSLHTPILQIRHCKKGESIGYGASHVFEKDTITATIAIGYADGFLRSHSNDATVYYNGAPCPVLGRVSMDLTTIDVSHLDTPPAEGDMIEVLGPHLSVDDSADEAGTIGYEILTSLGHRFGRVYKS
ncbi:MAG: alanine racemase [Pseudomonadota bacterium]